jgi:hypothetical protein
MLTSINSTTLLSESRHAPHRKCESVILWMGIKARCFDLLARCLTNEGSGQITLHIVPSARKNSFGISSLCVPSASDLSASRKLHSTAVPGYCQAGTIRKRILARHVPIYSFPETHTSVSLHA